MEITTKYNIGQEVWTSDGYEPIRKKIIGVQIEINGTQRSIAYKVRGAANETDFYYEDGLFATLEDLSNHFRC